MSNFDKLPHKEWLIQLIAIVGISLFAVVLLAF